MESSAWFPPWRLYSWRWFSARTFEALLGGCAIGFVIVEFTKPAEETSGFLPINAFKGFIEALSATMADPVIVWITLVVGLFGSLIALLIRSGGALAFGALVAEKTESRRGALVVAWFLGLLIFIDDYLNALTVSSAMRKVTDRYRVSREMLAYVVDSTAAPVCVLVPVSTWAIFTAGLLVENEVAETGAGILVYMTLVPFAFYAWIALGLVLLTALGIMPAFGPMKEAERRAQETGETIPPNSEKMAALDSGVESAVKAEDARLINFVLPIAALLLFSWLAGVDFTAEEINWLGGIDALAGVMTAIVVTSILFLMQRITSIDEFSNTFFKGFQSMIVPIAIVTMSFVLVRVNEALGLTNFVIETAMPLMEERGGLLPLIVFLTMAFIAFSTGSFWGMYAITLPIVIPLAQTLDVSLSLTLGAVISAGAFGSHLCPFGDATVLSSAGAGCNNFRHVHTQMPYGLLAGAITALLYLIFGFIL